MHWKMLQLGVRSPLTHFLEISRESRSVKHDWESQGRKKLERVEICCGNPIQTILGVNRSRDGITEHFPQFPWIAELLELFLIIVSSSRRRDEILDRTPRVVLNYWESIYSSSLIDWNGGISWHLPSLDWTLSQERGRGDDERLKKSIFSTKFDVREEEKLTGTSEFDV